MRSARPMCLLGLVILSTLGWSTPGAADQERPAPVAKKQAPSSATEFTVKNIDGRPVNLADFAGHVLLIVNVASECGLTKTNYERLGPLHAKYEDQGFRILAFPANNFGEQEPGTNAEIKAFCKATYDVKYDLFAKVSVKGDDICPLYEFLTEHPDEKIRGEVVWNFQKYLVGRDGKVLAKFHPRTAPDDAKLIAAIEKALEAALPVKDK